MSIGGRNDNAATAIPRPGHIYLANLPAWVAILRGLNGRGWSKISEMAVGNRPLFLFWGRVRAGCCKRI